MEKYSYPYSQAANSINDINTKLLKYNRNKSAKRINNISHHHQIFTNINSLKNDLSPKASNYSLKKRQNALNNSPMSTKTTKTNIQMNRNINLFPDRYNTYYDNNNLDSYRDSLNTSIYTNYEARKRMNKSSKNFYLANNNKNNYLNKNNLVNDLSEEYDKTYYLNRTAKSKHYTCTKSTETRNRYNINKNKVNAFDNNCYTSHHNSQNIQRIIAVKDNLIAALKKKNNELTKKLYEKERQLNSLSGKNNIYADNLTDNSTSIESENAYILKNKIQELNEQNLKLNKKLKLMMNNNNHLQMQKIMKENIYFKNEYKKLKVKLSEMEKNNVVPSETNFNETNKNSLFEQKYMLLKKETENLKNKNDKLIKEKLILEENNTNLKKQILDYMKNKEDNSNISNDLINQLISENNQLKEKLNDKKNDNNVNLLNKINELEKSNSELKKQNEILEIKIKNENILLNTNDINKEKQNELINKLKNDINNLEIENQSLKSKLLLDYKKENNDINEENKKLKLMNESLSQKNKELNDKIVDLTKNINEYKSKYDLLLSEKNEIKNSNDKLLLELELMKQKNNEDEEYKNENNKKDEEIVKLKEELKEIEQEKLELINTKNEISNKKYEYEDEIQKLKEELNLVKNDLEKFKEINTKLLEENARKQEEINNYENNLDNNETENNDNLLQKIKELNEIIEGKEQQIGELKEEIEKHKNNKNSSSDPYSGTNKRESSGEDAKSHTRHPSQGGIQISDEQKIEKLKERVNDYKNKFELNENLIKLLKEEIKELKNKLKDFETFGGKIKDYNEFIRAFNIIIKDYKPKKNEQKEALDLIKNHLKKELD